MLLYLLFVSISSPQGLSKRTLRPGVRYGTQGLKELDTIPAPAKKLINSYKDFVVDFTDNHLIFKDGAKLLWDDGIKNKLPQSLLNEPDLKDMFVEKYEKGPL